MARMDDVVECARICSKAIELSETVGRLKEEAEEGFRYMRRLSERSTRYDILRDEIKAKEGEIKRLREKWELDLDTFS